eukprot:TRINITY_DN2984_c0_g1_i1.p1 TRINITY_DN2984_c0_g1~~TRINITY_DN2984_c0_g1_i1.p1  ORF type:complete len:556 (+),score=122.98 TRINITY_DN2984_c0_g1_i1:131-1798(+)
MVSGKVRSDHAPFFSTLPPNDLVPLEAALRVALLDWLHYKPGPFPLVEWIHRRIGGEVETQLDKQGFHEIVLRGAGGPPPRATATSAPSTMDVPVARNDFFKTLPQNRFSPAEVQLREAIFEFLATWKFEDLATMGDLHDYPPVQRNRSSLLPRDVKLKEWIERRIGGEVELREGKKPTEQVVSLTLEGKRLVREKYEQLSRGNAVPALPEPSVKDAFFFGLPVDELLPAEIAMRQSIVDCLRTWMKTKPNSFLTMSDLAADPRIKTHREALLPPKVKLRAWIERRIGGEVVFEKGGPTGEYHLKFRGGAPPAKGTAKPNARPLIQESLPAKNTPARQFFADLPVDSFTDAEDELRLAVLDLLGDQADSSLLLVEFCRAFQKTPNLAEARAAVLPSEVTLQMWLNRRMSSEVEIAKDAAGRQIIRLREGKAETEVNPEDDGGVEADAIPNGNDEQIDQFFSSFPDDDFTLAEFELRDALLAFLGKWHKQEPPTVHNAKSDKDVAKVALTVLPRGCPVDLGVWIKRRIGGEINVDTHRKTLRLVMEESEAKKRKMN